MDEKLRYLRRLRRGEIILTMTPTDNVDHLISILNAAFPTDTSACNGTSRYYFRRDSKTWDCVNDLKSIETTEIGCDVISVTEFYNLCFNGPAEKMYTKDDLRSGNVAISFIDFTITEDLKKLQRIIADVFPKDKIVPLGGNKYYLRDPNTELKDQGLVTDVEGWMATDVAPKIPIVSVAIFYADNYPDAAAKNRGTLVGFNLKKLYPGCKHKVGQFERLTTGEFLRWPDFWEPKYEQPKTIVTHDGGKTFELVQVKMGFNYGQNFISIDWLKDILLNSRYDELNGWDISFTHVSIGCKHNIHLDEIKKLVDKYNEQYK